MSQKDDKNSIIYKAKLLPVIFIFSIMFSVEIAGIDTRYFVLAFWLVFGVIWSKRFVISSEVLFIPLGILCLLIYSVLISTVSGNVNSFEYLRLLRCILTYIIIVIFMSANKYTKEEIIASLLVVLSLHALATILGVVYPPFKDIILPISQYDKELLRYRSSGLLSGFDDAGMFCVFGMILDYLVRRQKNKGIGLYTIIFAIAAALSSRFNMILMLGILMIIMLYESRNNKIFSKLLVILLAVFAGIFVFVFWVLTTNVSPEIREYLLNTYPILNVFYISMLGSYTDYGVYTNVISRHWNPMPISFFERIFGMGLRITNTDIGYVKSMYSYGIMGIIWVMFFYIVSLKRIRHYYGKKSFAFAIYGICLLLMMVMEAKTAIFLSSTSFEMISLLYVCFILNRETSSPDVYL